MVGSEIRTAGRARHEAQIVVVQDARQVEARAAVIIELDHAPDHGLTGRAVEFVEGEMVGDAGHSAGASGGGELYAAAVVPSDAVAAASDILSFNANGNGGIGSGRIDVNSGSSTYPYQTLSSRPQDMESQTP